MTELPIIALAKSLPPWIFLGLGFFTGMLRTAWRFVYDRTIGYAISKISLTLSVEDSEHAEAYMWLSQWVEKRLKDRRINSLLLRQRTGDDDDDLMPREGKRTSYSLIPHYGTYYLRWKKWLPMMITHSMDSQTSMATRRKLHSIEIQIWFCRDREVLLEILREAQADFEADLTTMVKYYTSKVSDYDSWDQIQITPRPLSSIYLPAALVEDVMRDMENFLGNASKYISLGIPYRRGYQLGGPPGTGKSTFILALASHFRLPIYALKLSGPDLTGAKLTSALGECSKPAIVVIEDIDCLKVATSREAESTETLTMSDVLNAIDGIGASDGRIVIMTANHPERIDPALVRSGRIDRKFFIDYAEDEALKRFHERLAEHFPVIGWEEFRAALPEKATIADAQALAFQGTKS